MQVLVLFCLSPTAISIAANMALHSLLVYTFQKERDEWLKMTLDETSWMRKIYAWIVICS